MTRFSRFIAVAIVFACLSATNAKAELVWSLGVSGDPSTIGQTTFTGIKGTDLVLDVYIRQTGQRFEPLVATTVADTRLNTVSDLTGVGSFFAPIEFFGPDGNPSTDVLPADSFPVGPGFFADAANGLDKPNVLVGSANATPDVANTPPVPVYASNPNVGLFINTPIEDAGTGSTFAQNSILMGTMTVNIGSTAGGDYSVVIGEQDNPFQITLGTDLFDFLNSSELPQPLTATIAVAVPEPSHFAVLGLVGLGYVGHRRRRRAKAKAA